MTLLALALGEVLVRWLVGPPRALGELYYRDAAGERVGGAGEEPLAAALARGLVEPLPADQTPRQPRLRFAPGARFHLCYEDAGRLRMDWTDARGCVEVRINSFGLREREDLRPDNKAPGERRIVCIGDSLTFGWGVPVELCWVRLLEDALRSEGRPVRTVNCGASGALVVDEYWWGLRTRFAAFAPDVVLVTLCLNDLLPSSGLCVLGPEPPTSGSLLFDHVRRTVAPSPLDLDPAVDWVGLLLDLPREDGIAAGLYGPDKPFEAMWSQGAPQRAMAAMQTFCRERNVEFLVVLWPFLQGLGPGRHYPFAAMHAAVAAHCAKGGVPFLDLLPVLSGVPAEELWVSPADLHANPRAHRLVLPALLAFVAPHVRR